MDVRQFRPTDRQGATFVVGFLITTGLGLWLSLHISWWVWFVGQCLLATSLVQWFVLQHEAGHQTLFRTKKLNLFAGHLASLFCAIPFYPWRSIHSLHHKWTGWQDVDPTTNSLVPRELGTVERRVIDFCWLTWIPLFSVLYRTNNYWNIPRLLKILPRPHHQRRNVINVLVLFGVYVGLVVSLGPLLCLKLFGAAVLMSLIFCDPILFSQHNHMPQELSMGEKVKPHAPKDQVVYTRSLSFPLWISRWVLMQFDAHELHHKYPMVPGYRLHELKESMPNTHPWWRWIWRARRTRASVIMFQNRHDTGLDL